MKRDATGKFVSNWDSETKQRVSISLTSTAWRSLDEEAHKRGISRSEVIEHVARSFKEEEHLDCNCPGANADNALLHQRIIEQQQTIKALQHEKQELEALLENAPDAIARFDSQIRYLYANRIVEQVLGFPRDQLLGKSMSEFMSDPIYLFWEEHLRQVFATAQEQEIEFEFATAFGIRFYQSRLVPELDTEGTPISVVVICRDITESRQAQQQHTQIIADQETERQVATILESITDAFVAFDRNWHYTYVNQAAVQILHKTPEELIGKHVWNEVFPEIIGGVAYEALHRALAEQVPVCWEEFGEPVQRWLEANAYPSAEGVAVYFCDITERKQAEVERERLLQELETERARFEAVLRQMPAGVMIADAAIGICMFQDVTRLKQIETEQQFLIELNDAIRAIQDPKEIVWRVVCATGKYFNVTRCTYGDIDSTQEYVIVERDYCNGVISVAGSHQMNSFGPKIIAELKQGKTIVVDDVDRDPRTAGSGEAAFNAIQTKSLLCVPLVKQGRFVALFVLHHVSPRHWTAADVALMERIAQKTWLAVERSRAEEKLRESEAYLQFALKVGRMGTWNWDMQTSTIIWSEEHFKILGLQPHECKPSYKVWANQVHPDDLAQTKAKIQQAIADKNEYHYEYRLRWSDGSIHWIEARGQFIYDSQGNPQQSIGAVIDITERKQAEQERERLLERERIARTQAEAANRVKDEFLAVLSHELRSPLNPILGWTKMLRSQRLDRKKADLALETIERNAKLQAQLIEDLLDVSRILQGKMTLNVADVNLTTTIEAALETVRLAAEAKNIQIQTTFTPISGTVCGDSNRLQQVIWNLLSNAVKFTPSGGRIEMQLKQVGMYAQIQVKDTGIGISPEFLPHVFEYFQQEDGTTTRKFGGLGLGLAIVRHLTELHGGTVQAESPGQNLGAIFTVQLPLNIVEPELACNDNQKETVTHLTNLQILVVDDDADMRELAEFILTQSGAQVTTAASAVQALELLNQSIPDLLLCDIGMPEMDGYSLIRQIRKWSPQQGGNIPAIALTAYAGEINQQQALAAGFQMHISKPVDPEELVQTIVQVLDNFFKIDC